MRDAFAANPATFGGFVARIAADGRSATGTATLVDATTLALLHAHVARVAVRAPADALAALIEALAGLSAPPDIALVEGHGTADVRDTGIAMRFGEATGLPCIGVDTVVPPGLASRTNLHDMRGAFTPLRDGPRQVGWLMRSRVGCDPLVISPGHGVALASAPQLVLRCVRDDRLPEPLRLARPALE